MWCQEYGRRLVAETGEGSGEKREVPKGLGAGTGNPAGPCIAGAGLGKGLGAVNSCCCGN